MTRDESRTLTGLVLAALASFFAASAVLGGWPISSHSPQAALNEHQTITMTATDAAYLSPSSLKQVRNTNITVTQTLTGVAGSGNSSIAVWNVFTTTYDTKRHQELEPASRVAVFDRSNAALVNCCDADINGNGLTRESGIVGYVFPVGTRKQTYFVFDTVLNKPEPFTYSGTGMVDGIPAYRFTEFIYAAHAGYTLLSFRDPELYSISSVYWVDPVTGTVLDASEDEDLYLVRSITSSPVTDLFEANLSMTPGTVARLASQDARARSGLKVARWTRVAFLAVAVDLAALAWWTLARGTRRRRRPRRRQGRDMAADGAAISTITS
jgi:hypothetical protein